MKIEKYESCSINKVEIFNEERSIIVTIGKNEYCLHENKGGLEIQKHNGQITINPIVSNEIIIF